MPWARKPKKPDHPKPLLALLAAGDNTGIHDLLARLHPADIANLLVGPAAARPAPDVWSRVDVERMGEVLLELPEAVRAEMLSCSTTAH